MKIATLFLILCLAAVTLSAHSKKKRSLRLTGQYVSIGDELFYVERRSWIEGEPPATHEQALEVCTSLEMDLPDIVSPEKEAAVIATLETIVSGFSVGMPFWTSAFRGSDGLWMWTNLGQEMTYVNWDTEPTPGRNFAFFNNNSNGSPAMVPVIGSSNLPLVLCQEKPKPEAGYTCKRRKRQA